MQNVTQELVSKKTNSPSNSDDEEEKIYTTGVFNQPFPASPIYNLKKLKNAFNTEGGKNKYLFKKFD